MTAELRSLAESPWPAEPKMFLLWSFTERVCGPLVSMLSRVISTLTITCEEVTTKIRTFQTRKQKLRDVMQIAQVAQPTVLESGPDPRQLDSTVCVLPTPPFFPVQAQG